MIFAADVDDTVCPSTRPVEPELARQLVRIQALGYSLIFISGSTVPQIEEQLGRRLGVEHILLGATGTHAVAHDGQQGRELYREELPADLRHKVLNAYRDLVQRHGIQPATSEADQLQDRGTQLTLSAIGRHAPEAAKRSFDPDGSRRRAWISELKAVLGDSVDLHVGGTTSIDATAPGVDKAWGLKRYLASSGRAGETIIYFGDQLSPGGNDYPVRPLAHCVQVEGTRQSLQYLEKIQDPAVLPDLPYLSA